MTIATIMKEEDYEVLLPSVLNHTRWWIGAKRIDFQTGHIEGYYWHDGNDFTKNSAFNVANSYQHWIPNEPNGKNDHYQRCLSLRSDHNNFGMHDAHCVHPESNTYRSVCQKRFCTDEEVNGKEDCLINKCTCPNGTPVADTACHHHGEIQCATCNLLFHLSSGNGTSQICEPNICNCENGTPVGSDSCSTHGSNQCESCNEYRHLTSDHDCKQNQCTCTDGEPAYPECPEHGKEVCESCYPEQYLSSGKLCIYPDINKFIQFKWATKFNCVCDIKILCLHTLPLVYSLHCWNKQNILGGRMNR